MRKHDIKPIYFQSFLIRGSASIVHASLVVGIENWSEAGLVIAFQVASFYLTFDAILNFWTGDKWNYQGKSSGYLDKLPMWAYLGLKVLCLIYLVHFIWTH
jgi:hypothetical protein